MNAPNSYWIGLQRNNETNFQWVDGTFPIDYSFWADGDGKNASTNERCAIIGSPTANINIASNLVLHWFDIDCAGLDSGKQLSGYICQKNEGKSVSLKAPCRG